jgi:hypothetical protein
VTMRKTRLAVGKGGTFSVVTTKMFENLDVTTDLFTGTKFPSATINEICDQFVSSARFLVDDNFTTAEDRDFADRFHECIFDVLGPYLLRVLLC